MPIDHDLIDRINSFVVAADPLRSYARMTGHRPELWVGRYQSDLAAMFIRIFDERASELAVNVRQLLIRESESFLR